MKPSRRKASLISLAVAMALAAVLLVLAFRGVDWAAMASRLRQAQLDLLVVAFCTGTTSYFVRGLRWRILLSAERPVLPTTAFWGTAAGYLGNSFLPARAGELVRSALIARKTGISISYVLATAVVERVLDAGALVLISSGAVATLGAAPLWLATATRVMSALAVVGIAAFFVIPRIHGWIELLLARLVPPGMVRDWLSSVLAQAVLGLRAINSVRRASGFAGLTAVIWLLDAFSAIIVARAFALTLALPQALLLLAALGLSSAAPSTPGYLGIFQFVAVTVLAPFGFSQAEALAFIIGWQAVTYIIAIVWGLIGLWNLGARRVPGPTQSEESKEVAAVEGASG